jgi:peptide chain release factor 3
MQEHAPQDMSARHEIGRRRTFAIIAHPDAGKTTLTEKLLLYGGVIQLAGAVKAKRGRASAVSDWMEMERERGISITTSVLQFPYRGLQMNLLDTPGHADFSEDTYRTLHAVDGAVMLLDCAKGVEAQTRKLFRVCRQRSIPIFTFVNKMDRPGRDAFELVGEVESVLGIGVFPITWPIFRGGTFRGVYHRLARRVYLFDEDHATSSAGVGAERPPVEVTGLDDPSLAEALDQTGYDRLRHDAELLDAAGDGFDRERFEAGVLSPMFFGSAINNFGLEAFLETFGELMPPPRPRDSDRGPISPTQDEFSGFVFKIQANMDRAHRDRVAFVRICSGRLSRGMKAHHVRTGREVRLANPTQFLARERSVVEDGFAGDVVGIHDPGTFEIGDTLTGGSRFAFEAIPSFAPEHFTRLVLVDPMRRKQFAAGLEQLAQEGTVQLYRPPAGRSGDLVLGALGQLQFEVVKYRLEKEYGVEVRREAVPYQLARWVSRADGGPLDVDALHGQLDGLVVLDVRDRVVALFDREWALRTAEKLHPELRFAEAATGVVVRAA